MHAAIFVTVVLFWHTQPVAAADGRQSAICVSHNRISGTVHASATDCGGYSATGIVMYADFRWGRTGPAGITSNDVINNLVSLVSDTPTLVDVVAIDAIELSEALDPDPPTHVIHDNTIGFNGLQGTELQFALTPEGPDTVNDISRDLGENRGHRLHPSAFHED